MVCDADTSSSPRTKTYGDGPLTHKCIYGLWLCVAVVVAGCAARIHSGYSCNNSTAQEGPFYKAPVTVNPWIEERYTTDGNGRATFGGIVTTGSSDIGGRAFISKYAYGITASSVHVYVPVSFWAICTFCCAILFNSTNHFLKIVYGAQGERLICGLLSEVALGSGRILAAMTAPLDDSGVVASVSAVSRIAGTDQICIYGSIRGLEPSLTSFLAGGSDCNVANGCGAHIHEGTECTSTETQMGHYYSTSVDPWETVGYLSTDANGAGQFVECVDTGTAARHYDGKAFVIHDSTGARVSCGILSIMLTTTPTTQPTSMAPTVSPTAPTSLPTTVAPSVVEPTPQWPPRPRPQSPRPRPRPRHPKRFYPIMYKGMDNIMNKGAKGGTRGGTFLDKHNMGKKKIFKRHGRHRTWMMTFHKVQKKGMAQPKMSRYYWSKKKSMKKMIMML